MTSHCNGNHSKTSLSVALPSSIHNPSYVTASRCARRFRLKELSDWQDLTARGMLFHTKGPEKGIHVLNMSIPGIEREREREREREGEREREHPERRTVQRVQHIILVERSRQKR